MELNKNTILALVSTLGVLAGAFGQPALQVFMADPAVAQVLILVLGLFGLLKTDSPFGGKK